MLLLRKQLTPAQNPHNIRLGFTLGKATTSPIISCLSGISSKGSFRYGFGHSLSKVREAGSVEELFGNYRRHPFVVTDVKHML